MIATVLLFLKLYPNNLRLSNVLMWTRAVKNMIHTQKYPTCLQWQVRNIEGYVQSTVNVTDPTYNHNWLLLY